ncbi:hypothetical protein HUG10_03750 [Halorarum halophilum]|uniref:Gins51 C-terminal domain-containing protein n=1 Tax=Halorarum halophilum TaxID=2743090 RepID=A0A7D5GW89_9EURY|nr:hypothetical protein [Halobaculum halophilum]QLG26709.1 hypothetical protein HUG10_03750 [Halobaculum halophilum]
MDLDELRGVQSTERQRDSLQHLRDTFYEDVAAYIAGRKQRRDERAASVDNPFSDEQVRKLSDEIETAEEVVESLYERRIGKVVKLSSFAAADAPVDTEGMTTEEADLFDDLVGRIERNKETVLDVLGGATDVDLDAQDAAGSSSGTSHGASEGTPDPAAPTPEDGVATADAGGDVLADAMGGEDQGGDAGLESTSPAGASDDDPPVPPEEPDPSGDETGQVLGGNQTEGDGGVESSPERAESEPGEVEPGQDDTRTTVRITRDIGQILGVDDREYDLESEDVVSLPAANAGPLVDRDAAERLE